MDVAILLGTCVAGMTSKELEFPVMALLSVAHTPGEDDKEAARVFYVAATRATQRLGIGVGRDGGSGMRFALRVLAMLTAHSLVVAILLNADPQI